MLDTRNHRLNGALPEEATVWIGAPVEMRRLHDLAETAHRVAMHKGLDDKLLAIAEAAQRSLGATVAAVGLSRSEDRQDFRAVAPADQLVSKLTAPALPEVSGFYAAVCARGAPLRRTWPATRRHLGPPWRSWLGAPLIGPGGLILGLIQAARTTDEAFTDADEAMMVVLAHMAAGLVASHLTVETLVEERETLREAQDIAELGRWEYSPATGRVTWSEELFRIFGRDPAHGAPTYEEFRSLLHPDDLPRFDENMKEAGRRAATLKDERRIRRPDGSYRWIRSRTRSYCDETGTVARMAGTIIDITERKQAEERIQDLLEQRDALLREAHHRIKNNIASVSSMLLMQSYQQTSRQTREQLLGAVSRVRTIGHVHEVLYRSGRFDAIEIGDHLRTLLAEVATSFWTIGEAPPTVRVDCPQPVTLPTDVATPLSLVAVELVMNALKHGGSPDGTVAVAVEIEAGDPMRLGISDNGPGFPECPPAMADTFGLKLSAGLVRHLGGSITFANRGSRDEPTGAVVTVTVPVPPEPASAPPSEQP